MHDPKTARTLPAPLSLPLLLLLALAAFAPHAQQTRSEAQPAQSAPAEYAPGGAQLCLLCHGPDSNRPGHDILDTPHALIGHPGSAFAGEAQQCQACHGPSAAHLQTLPGGGRPSPAVAFVRGESATDRNAMCTGCHQREAGLHWPSSAHQFQDVACTDCHRVHAAPDPVMTRAGQTAVCYDCHQRERAEMARLSAHPVQDGFMQCSDCHAPHGGPGPASLLRPTLNESCYDCHADKRGPFLWEHAPVREDCTQCHVPHGSNHRDLLASRTPFLCQQCHLAQFHPSVVASGAGLPPFGASSSILGQNCMNCHTQVHGSNHPSGPGLTR